ncbi:MAG: putative bifunctional diguanylate cyclase/phosphodiesterase [Acidimicrobiales bacterium]
MEAERVVVGRAGQHVSAEELSSDDIGERLVDLLEASGTLAWELDLATGEPTWWTGESGAGRHAADPGSLRRGALVDPGDRERVLAVALASIDGARKLSMTQPVTMGDGTKRWFALTGEVVAGTEGEPGRMHVIALDVTREHDTLDRLRMHSEQARELVVRLRTGPHLGFEYVSPACLFFTGYTEQEMYDNGMAYAFSAIEPTTVACIRRDLLVGSIEGKSYDFPTRRKDGSVLWVRALFHQSVDDAGDMVFEVAIRDIGQMRALELEVTRLRLTDGLTGLSSRQALEEQWPLLRERAHAASSWTVLAHVDVDRFGLVNSGLGIAAGDKLLRAVARRLAESVGAGDLVVRLGGDDFVVLVTGIESRTSALAATRGLADAFVDPIPSDAGRSFVTVSVGATLVPSGPWSAEDSLDMRLAEADVAMRVAKARGGNGVEVFAEGMRTEARDKAELLAGLRDAVEGQEFVLHYQPIVDLATRAIVGAEALVRWQHPGRGLLPPSEFIGLAEESGWIVPIGAWVVENACSAARSWRGVHGRRPTIAVNLSARQLSSVDLVGVIGSALERSGLPPGDLVLEITETAFIDDFDAAVWTLRRVGDLGVHLALDDFGTGYSSLAYLAQLPIDRVKIDRSMVAGLHVNPHSRAVVAGIVGMAEALAIETIAEGVESLDQLAMLVELGCDLAQGYVFSRPVPLVDMVALLEATDAADARPSSGQRCGLPQ